MLRSAVLDPRRQRFSNSSFETSSGTPYVFRKNLAQNPRQVSTGNFIERQTRFSWVGSWVSQTWHPFITTATRYTAPSSPSSSPGGVDFGGNADLATPSTTGNWIAYPVLPGQTIVVSASAYGSKLAGWNFQYRFHDGLGNWVGVRAGGSSFADGQEGTTSITVPAGAAYFVARIQLGGAVGSVVAGDWFEYTGIRIETGVVVPSGYFDGGLSVPIRVNLATDPRATTYVGSAFGVLGWRNTRWFGGGTATGTYTTVTGASDGPLTGISTYARKTWTAINAVAGDLGFDHNPLNTRRTVPGDIWSASSYLRASATYGTGGASGAAMTIRWYDATGTFLSQVEGTRVALPGGQWVRISATATAPASAAQIIIVSDLDGVAIPSTGFTLDGTGLQMEQGSTVNSYMDGSYNPGLPSGQSTAWASTANGSVSYSYDPEMSVSWSGTVNSSASNLTSDRPASVYELTGNTALSRSARWASSGTRSCRVIPLGSSTSTYVQLSPNDLSILTPGRTYTVQAVCHVESPLAGTPNANARKIVFTSSVGSPLSSAAAPNVAGSYLLSFTFTVPQSATWATVQLWNGASAGNGDIWWDDVVILG